MMSFNRGLAKTQLALLLALAAPACGRDSPTEPASSDEVLWLEAVSATQLEGTVDEPVSPVPTVRVINGTGRPVHGIRVTFLPFGSSPEHGGFVTRHTVLTDLQGEASPGNWTLGTLVGPHLMEAYLLDAHLSPFPAGPGRVVGFYAEAKAR